MTVWVVSYVCAEDNGAGVGGVYASETAAEVARQQQSDEHPCCDFEVTSHDVE